MKQTNALLDKFYLLMLMNFRGKEFRICNNFVAVFLNMKPKFWDIGNETGCGNVTGLCFSAMSKNLP